MECVPNSGEIYRHFKNKLYQVITVAEHSEDGQKLVIYQALYGTFKTYARPLEMFLSEVDHEKYPNVEQKYRFERVELTQEKVVEEQVLETTTGSGSVQEVDITEQEQCAVSVHEETAKSDSEGSFYEQGVEPGLLAFLDEENWDMKYNILVSLRDKMTDRLVDNLAVALDVVIPEGPLDERYEQLKFSLRTRQKYESQHLR